MFIFISLEAGSIKVIFTSALIEDPDEERKKCYIQNLINLKNYGCEVFVVESCIEGPSYLDCYCDKVYYTKSNDLYETKSNNEIKSMLIGLLHYDFEPEDLILKVTGRYVLEDDQLINFVKLNENADVIARVWNDIDAYTGYYAIKYKYLLDMFDYYFYIYNNKSKNFAVEHALGNFISMNKDNLKIIRIPKLYDYASAPESK